MMTYELLTKWKCHQQYWLWECQKFGETWRHTFVWPSNQQVYVWEDYVGKYSINEERCLNKIQLLIGFRNWTFQDPQKTTPPYMTIHDHTPTEMPWSGAFWGIPPQVWTIQMCFDPNLACSSWQIISKNDKEVLSKIFFVDLQVIRLSYIIYMYNIYIYYI